jgi:hypothetical protein
LIKQLLADFKGAVEARAIDCFWDSRKNNRLRLNPEKFGQALLAVFAKGVIGKDGLVLREVVSGIGFVDIAIVISSVLHLLELKILRSSVVGVDQLAKYMATEGRRRGWLVLFDVRSPDVKSPVTRKLRVASGVIEVLVIDVNPAPPSKLAANP